MRKIEKLEVENLIKRKIAPFLEIEEHNIDETKGVIDELKLDDDDFSAIAIELEQELSVKPQREKYRSVLSVSDWASLLISELEN